MLAASGVARAQTDFSGEWTRIREEDSVLNPDIGDWFGIPMNDAARRRAETWDPSSWTLLEWQCRPHGGAYFKREPSALQITKEMDPVTGAAVIMQVPGRLRIAWADDSTLRVETDSGQQTRLFHFGRPQPPSGEPTWQGHSVAEWLPARGQAREVNVEPRPARTGTLKVVTRGMRQGYLRNNGVPYSGDAVVTEYFTPFTDTRGNRYFNVQVVVEDPQYLTDVYGRSMQFRSEPDGSKWNPQPCTAH